MKSMKFYIYSSNIAVIIFGILFIGIGCKDVNYVLIGLGVLLTIYGIARLYRMLKALKCQEELDDELLDK